MMKIVSWIMVNGVTVLALVQTLIKAIKEVLTGIVNILSLFMSAEQAEKVVRAVRNAVNIVDGVIEKIKDILLNVK